MIHEHHGQVIENRCQTQVLISVIHCGLTSFKTIA